MKVDDIKKGEELEEELEEDKEDSIDHIKTNQRENKFQFLIFMIWSYSSKELSFNIIKKGEIINSS